MALWGGVRAIALAAMLLLAVTVGLIVPAICSYSCTPHVMFEVWAACMKVVHLTTLEACSGCICATSLIQWTGCLLWLGAWFFQASTHLVQLLVQFIAIIWLRGQ